MAQDNRTRTQPARRKRIGPGRRAGLKRQRVSYDLCDPRATDAPDPIADLSLNYELELANFTAIPDQEQEPEEEEPLPEPEEPASANLDPSDLLAYFSRVQAECAREAFILNGNKLYSIYVNNNDVSQPTYRQVISRTTSRSISTTPSTIT